MLVPLATDIPLCFVSPIAWKLLNHRSTASRSSLLQRSSSCLNLVSTFKNSFKWFWRFSESAVAELITVWCAKCSYRQDFEHFYSARWNRLARSSIHYRRGEHQKRVAILTKSIIQIFKLNNIAIHINENCSANNDSRPFVLRTKSCRPMSIYL